MLSILPSHEMRRTPNAPRPVSHRARPSRKLASFVGAVVGLLGAVSLHGCCEPIDWCDTEPGVQVTIDMVGAEARTAEDPAIVEVSSGGELETWSCPSTQPSARQCPHVAGETLDCQRISAQSFDFAPCIVTDGADTFIRGRLSDARREDPLTLTVEYGGNIVSQLVEIRVVDIEPPENACGGECQSASAELEFSY